MIGGTDSAGATGSDDRDVDAARVASLRRRQSLELQVIEDADTRGLRCAKHHRGRGEVLESRAEHRDPGTADGQPAVRIEPVDRGSRLRLVGELVRRRHRARAARPGDLDVDRSRTLCRTDGIDRIEVDGELLRGDGAELYAGRRGEAGAVNVDRRPAVDRTVVWRHAVDDGRR